MAQQQLDKKTSFILLAIIAILAGPIGWLIILIWFFSQKNSGESLRDAFSKNPQTESKLNDLETRLKSVDASPIEVQSGLANQAEWGRIILAVLLILALAGVIIYIFLA